MTNQEANRGDRHKAWSAVRQALLLVESTSPCFLVATGPSGSGKTRFLAEVSEFARARGLRIARVDAHDAAIPLLAVDRLTRELGSRTDNLPSGIERVHLLRAACERAAAGRPGVAILVDNASDLLPPDRSALVDLVLSPPCGNLLVAIAVHQAATSADPFSGVGNWPSSSAGRARARRMEITLDPMTADEVVALAESRFGVGTTASRFADSVVFLSAGLMSHVETILDRVASLGQPERQLVLSGSEFVEQALTSGPPLRRVLGSTFDEGIDPVALIVARGLGAWMRPAPIRHLATLLELDPEVVGRHLAAAEDRGLIAQKVEKGEINFRFTIPLARMEVVRDTPELIRRHLHARVATIKEDSGWPTDAAVMAHHYLVGHVDLIPDRLALVTQAAQMLTRRSRYARAQRILREALAQLHETRLHDELPAEALALLAETLSRSGEPDEAARILVRNDPAELPSAESVIRRARDHVASGQDAIAIGLLEAELASENLDPVERLQVIVDLGRLLVGQGRLDEGAQLSTTAYAEAITLGEVSAAVEAQITSHVRFLYDALPRHALVHGRKSLVLAHRHSDKGLQARTLSAIGNALTDSAGLLRAFKWLQRARERAEAAEDFATLSWTTQLLALNCIERGDWRAAEQMTSNVTYIDDVLHRSRSLRLSTALQHWLQALRGYPSELLPPADHLDLAHATGRAEVIVFQAMCERWLLTDHASRALSRATEMVYALEAQPGNRRQLITYALPSQAMIAFELQDAETLASAESRLGMLLREVGHEHGLVLPESCLTTAMSHAVRGEWALVAPASLQAASAFEQLGYRRRAAAALQLTGNAYRELGNTELAHRYLTEAFIAFRDMGATPRMDAIRPSFHLLGRRTPRDQQRPGELTARQWQIAIHAADGKSNREIAAILGIRYRTVTTHISNILHTLQMKTRSDLSDWISDTH